MQIFANHQDNLLSLRGFQHVKAGFISDDPNAKTSLHSDVVLFCFIVCHKLWTLELVCSVKDPLIEKVL